MVKNKYPLKFQNLSSFQVDLVVENLSVDYDLVQSTVPEKWITEDSRPIFVVLCGVHGRDKLEKLLSKDRRFLQERLIRSC